MRITVLNYADIGLISSTPNWKKCVWYRSNSNLSPNSFKSGEDAGHNSLMGCMVLEISKNNVSHITSLGESLPDHVIAEGSIVTQW